MPFSFLERATPGIVKAKKGPAPLHESVPLAPAETQPKQVRLCVCAVQDTEWSIFGSQAWATPALVHMGTAHLHLTGASSVKCCIPCP